MLEITSRSCDGCAEFQWVDTTGPYNALTNAGGYGVANGVLGPASFDTYTLYVRYPGTAITDDPDFTFNLLTTVPTPDSSGHYTWTITAAQMGLAKLVSGVYTMTAIGIISGVSYITDSQCLFLNDLESLVDAAMLTYDPVCGCKSGCEDPAELFVQFLTIRCGGVCDLEKAQAGIDDLYSRLPLCC